KEGEEERDEERGDEGVHRYSIALSSSGAAAASARPRTTPTRSSTIATSSTTAPTAIPICGIQSGVASLPWEMSFSFHESQTIRPTTLASTIASTPTIKKAAA